MLLQTKKFMIKQIAYIFVIILVFNFSLVKAEEEIIQESEVNVPVLADESDATAEEFEELPETKQEVSVENIPEYATGTEQIQLNSNQEPIIFVFDSAEEETESGSSTSLIAQADDENLIGTSTASSTDSIADIESINSSSTEPVSSSTEESFVSGGSPRIPIIGSVSSAVFDKPEIIAQWQMLDSGDDDSADPEVQILPSGKYKVDKKYTACVIAANSFEEINSAEAIVSYPENVAFDKAQTRGCGQKKSEISLNKIAKEETIELVCNKIRNNNNNLLNWQENKESHLYDYADVCGLEGFLARENVSLFCAESALAFDDPAGEYEIVVTIKDSKENFDEARNILKYLELTTFENDFSDFQYGAVNENKLKIIAGDSVWGNSLAPTVRNIGNTRLQIKIQQNDFNLGKTNNIWNIEYRTRVGENAEWLSYFPEQTAHLKDSLDLGQTANIDFGILIKKYPEDDNQSNFSGEMILSAEKVPGLICQK